MPQAKTNALFTSAEQKRAIAAALFTYLRLPFAEHTVPGAIMESLLAHVRGGKVLGTYDFVDVVLKAEKLGWQVKSTKSDTPVTWKRAKIPNQQKLISDSKTSTAGRQALGNAIVGFCNAHAKASLEQYGLDAIGYARLIANKDGTITFFEKLLCTRKQPLVFRPVEFVWEWSEGKAGGKKEMLPAFHGRHVTTGKKWFAWHGLGENQLHLTGEVAWWPGKNSTKAIRFPVPAADAKISWEQFGRLLDKNTSS
jgi:hypothetical protein